MSPLFHPFRRPLPALVLLIAVGDPARADTAADVDAVPDTIVVTANRVPGPTDLAGSAVSVLDSGTLDNHQVITVYDELRTLPGIGISNTGGPGGVTGVRLRGLDEWDVKVLFDGVEIADPASTAPYYDFASLLSAGIDRIEVVRGPQSTLWGSDAMGGVINIISKTGRDAPGGEVRVEAGSYGTEQGAASYRGALGAFDYAATLAGTNTDGIVSAEPRNGNTERDPYDNLTALARLGYQATDWLDLRGLFRFVKSGHTYPGYSPITFLPADAPGQTQEQRELLGRVEARFHFDEDRLEATLGAHVASTDRDYLYYDVRQYFYRGHSDALDGTLSYRPLDQVTVVLGGESRAESYLDDTALSASQRTDGGFAELQAMPLERLSATVGVRHDSVEGGPSATTWRATGSWAPLDRGPRLHGSYGTGFKQPSLYQRFVDVPFVVRGDRDLRPERSRGWDVGIEQKLWDDRLALDATWFSNDIHDLIAGGFDETFTYVYGNLGHATTEGAELALTAHPLPSLTVNAQYTFLETHDLIDGGGLLRRPRHTLAATADWRITDDLSAYAGVTWIGKRGESESFSPPPTFYLAPYALVRLGGAWQVTPWLKAYARIENLLDRRYEDVFGYGEPGRAAYAGIAVGF